MNDVIPSTRRRLGARFIDEAGIGLLCAPVWAGVITSWGDAPIGLSWSLVAYLLVATVAYEFVGVWLFGQSPGKWALGLSVIDARDPDRPLSFESALLRAVALRGSFFFCGFGLFAPLWWRYDRTHVVDWISGTRVVGHGTPRAAMKLHPWWAVALFIFGTCTGLMDARRFLSEARIARDGISWSTSSADEG